mmetsp:Transcript_69487/g.203309  ORF Transcript_69487/g.203309 Transcript_69487/m.203309 type:complete len:230 (+) Transcript_69487:195-884(+)
MRTYSGPLLTAAATRPCASATTAGSSPNCRSRSSRSTPVATSERTSAPAAPVIARPSSSRQRRWRPRRAPGSCGFQRPTKARVSTSAATPWLPKSAATCRRSCSKQRATSARCWQQAAARSSSGASFARASAGQSAKSGGSARSRGPRSWSSCLAPLSAPWPPLPQTAAATCESASSATQSAASTMAKSIWAGRPAAASAASQSAACTAWRTPAARRSAQVTSRPCSRQ